MLAMGTDGPHHGYPQRSEPAPFPTLPPFAELFSSSSSSSSSAAVTDELPSYDHDRLGDSASLVRSMPPSASALSAHANAERPSWSTENHASPRASLPKSNSSAMPPAHHFHHRHPASQPAAPRGSVLTSEVCQNLQDQAHSQTPISAPRQDSAVHPSLDFSFSSFAARSPRTAHRQLSPRPNSHSSTQSSPVLPSALPQSHHTDSQSASHHSLQSQSSSLSSNSRSSTTLPRPLENPGEQSTSIDTKSPSKNMGPSPTHDQANGTNSSTNSSNNTANTLPARGRYNVRFAANYTSENMPSSQKHRQEPTPTLHPSPPSPAPVPMDRPSTSQQQPAPSEEPSIQLFNASLQTQDTSQHLQPRPKEGDSSVERCQGCNEAWRRPLPNIEQFRQVSPAETGLELSMTSHNLIAQLRDHRLKADAAYEQWKWHHSHCVTREGYVQPTSPSSMASPDDSYAKHVESASQNGRNTEATVSKRKSDVLHDEDDAATSKLRKVTFEEKSTAPPVRPSAPA